MLGGPPGSRWAQSLGSLEELISAPQFIKFRADLGDVLRSDLASDQTGSAFEKPQPKNVVVKKPEESLSGHADRQKFQQAASFLGIAKQPRPDRIITPASRHEESMPQPCLPGRVPVVPVQIRFESLEVLMDQGRPQIAERTRNDQPLVNFHVHSRERFVQQLLKASAAAPEKQHRAKRKPTVAESPAEKMKPLGDDVGVGCPWT